MSNQSTSVVRLSNFPPKLLNVPPNYPLGPAPGKLQLLLNSNSYQLYHKYSPFTNHNDSILGGILSDQQPFVYTYIDQFQNSTFNQLPESVKGLADIANINQDSINDIIRVSKFLISSWGVQFLITQTAIQRTAPFDETRIYNPLSPILATVQPLTLGIGNLPTRHIEGGLLGLTNSVASTVGINLTNGFQKPQSTAGSDAAPDAGGVLSNLAKGQGKGLIRGSDANTALVALKQRWGATQSTGTSLGLSGLLSTIGSSFKAFFGGAPKSSGTYRADEQASDLMWNSKTLYTLQFGTTAMMSWFQPWYNGNTGTRPDGMFKLWPTPQSITNNIIIPHFQYYKVENRTTATIPNKSGGNMPVGYPPSANGNKYTDSIFPAKDQQYTNSDMLINFADYIKPEETFVTKLSDQNNEQVIKMNEQLSYTVQRINKFAGNTYNVTSAVLSGLLPSGLLTKGTALGYNRINTIKDLKNQNNTGPNSVRQEYKYGSPGVVDHTIPKTVDEKMKLINGTSLRMATTFMSDGINQLGVLNKSKKFNVKGEQQFPTLTKTYTGWTEYKPYEDDLIAFFFYDVVNDKYIPFRATVKGISEGNTALWKELRFIGRSDQLYSYDGFSRTLSFTFNVVINSVNELLPSWKKINYIASSVKPSNYTQGQKINQLFNKFIVPPMFMLTIGDLYKFQPMVIISINVNIPDDASWETLNQENSKNGWSYLNGLITAPSISKNYGQLPREAEIAITCNLLEKERATIGGSHFGHEPRVDNWETQRGDNKFLIGGTDTPYLPQPTELHKNFVEWNTEGSSNQSTSNNSTTQQSAAKANATSGITPTQSQSTSNPTTSGINASK
jgi:hypothetical protein